MSDYSFDPQAIFDSYTDNDKLNKVNIIHIYDTGIKCIDNNTGFHDSRHFRLVGFNTILKYKRDFGEIFDNITSFQDSIRISTIRVYNDGSFIIVFKQLYDICTMGQSVMLDKMDGEDNI